MRNCSTNQSPTTRGILRMSCVTAFGVALTIGLPQAARAQSIAPPPVPAGIEVLPPNEPFLLGRGVGTQNYVCQPADSIGHIAWTLFTPQATLFGDQQEQLITHFSSPNPVEGGIVRVTWEDSLDTSTVWAQAVKAVTVNPNAIPWVKLQMVGTQVGPTGGDTLSRTTFIQRVNTEGGLAPASGCDLPTNIGNKRFVPYRADYFFYRQN
jgi:Protein of unknown function (DUF3455)